METAGNTVSEIDPSAALDAPQCRSVSGLLRTAIFLTISRGSSLVVGGKFGLLWPNDRRFEIAGISAV